MKLPRRLATAMTAGSILFFAAAAQAQSPDRTLASPGEPTQMTSPAPVTTNTTPNTTTNITNNIPAPAQNTTPTTTRVVTPDVNITNNIPAPASNTTPVRVPAAQAPTTTQIEVRNETPAVNTAPATTPNIDIDMPDMPDINVVAPADTSANDTDSQTVTRTDRVIINDDEDDRDVNNNSILYMAIFGILAVFLIAVVAMAISRRRTIDDVI